MEAVLRRKVQEVKVVAAPSDWYRAPPSPCDGHKGHRSHTSWVEVWVLEDGVSSVPPSSLPTYLLGHMCRGACVHMYRGVRVRMPHTCWAVEVESVTLFLVKLVLVSVRVAEVPLVMKANAPPRAWYWLVCSRTQIGKNFCYWSTRIKKALAVGRV